MRKFRFVWICLGFTLLGPAVFSPAAAGALPPRSALAHAQRAVTLVDGYLHRSYEHRRYYYHHRRPLTYWRYAPRAYYAAPACCYAPPVVYLPPPVVEYSAPDLYVDCVPPPYVYERRCCEGW
jgi:hypothetical protein